MCCFQLIIFTYFVHLNYSSLSPFRDYYALLDIPFSATEANIKTAYRKMARLFHPDMHPEETERYTVLFREINEAYETLSDSYKKEMYDLQYKRNVLGEEPVFEEYYYEPQFEYQEYEAPVQPKRKSYVPFGAFVVLLIFFVRMFSNITPAATEAKYNYNNVVLSPAIRHLVDSLNSTKDTVDLNMFQSNRPDVIK